MNRQENIVSGGAHRSRRFPATLLAFALLLGASALPPALAETESPAAPITAPSAEAPRPAAAGTILPKMSFAEGQYTLWGMVKSTDAVVKAVMVILVLASVLTWSVWLAKTIELSRARRRLTADLSVLNAADAIHSIPALGSRAANLMLEAVRAEMARAGDLRLHAAAEGLKERVTVRLLSVETALARRMTQGTNIIASVGATAPFVGLFGTVWGIMNSFIGIAKAQTTNLTVVAPGIAEALLTTAMGLAAAVPAVLIYNFFARSISGYRALLADASNAAACVLSLDIERRQLQVNSERLHPRREAAHGL